MYDQRSHAIMFEPDAVTKGTERATVSRNGVVVKTRGTARSTNGAATNVNGAATKLNGSATNVKGAPATSRARTARLTDLLGDRKKSRRYLLLLLWLVLAAYPLIEGYSYYLTPRPDRPYSELHETFKPSGLIGQGLGIIGSLLMLFGVVSYMARKRWTFMQKFGSLRAWLTFHIFLCTLGPFLVLLHTTFKFGNIASISFWSMAIVVASGVFGRYVYIHIPKAPDGRFYTPQDLKHAQEQLVRHVAKMTRLHPQDVVRLIDRVGPTRGIIHALYKTIRFKMQSRGLEDYFEQALAARGVPANVRSKVIPSMQQNAQLQLRRRVLGPFVRAFGYWHVLHIPLALVMLAALIIHIAVAIAFGYTWIF